MAHISMEQALAGAAAGAAEVSRYGKRFVRMIWDPEPTNDTAYNSPVWCLGCPYSLEPLHGSNARIEQEELQYDRPLAPPPPVFKPAGTQPQVIKTGAPAKQTPLASVEPIPSKGLDTPPASTSSSLTSSLAYDELEDGGGWPPAFIDDFDSRVWMTYRSGFPVIERSSDPKANMALSLRTRLKTLGDNSGFTSDSGWGCMIRSGQSLLANALLIDELGRGWRRGQNAAEERRILSQFADDPRASYSIHSFVRHGAVACGKYPGEWFGPSATARCIRALTNANEDKLRVYSTGDLPDIFEDSFMAIAKEDGENFHPTLILVGTRLGLETINPVYWEALMATLQMPQSVGIAGGRPMSSHYFVGVQRAGEEQGSGSYFYYLDPHYTRPTLPYHDDSQDYTQAEIDTCHTKRLRRLHVRELDPSMLIGFLIKDEEDWENWKDAVKYVQGKSIINVAEHDPARGSPVERAEAIDEVETLSDEDDDDDDTILDA